MHPPRPSSNSVLLSRHAAPALIGFGVVILLLHIALPTLPIAAAFALVGLGASITTVKQFGRPVVIAGHVVVYFSLYVLLVAAMFDKALSHSQAAFSMTQTIDLGLSAGIMAFVVRLSASALNAIDTAR